MTNWEVQGMGALTNGAEREAEKQGLAVEYRATDGFSEALHQIGVTLHFSSQERGLVGSVWAESEDTLGVLFSHLPNPTGIATSQRKLAIATTRDVTVFSPVQNVTLKGRDTPFDMVFVPVHSFVTGKIDAHDVAWANEEELLVVNAAFSNVSAMDRSFNFRPVWQPPFVEETTRLDMCHLNGFALKDGSIAFATALGETHSRDDWRKTVADGGILMDASINQVVLRGLSMPYSPRLHGDSVLFLNSGRRELCRYHGGADYEVVTPNLPGFARGMTVVGNHAFIGLSKAREVDAFGGSTTSPESEFHSGICLVDLNNGNIVSFFELVSGINDVSDVVPIPVRKAAILGTRMEQESAGAVWTTPEKTYVF